MAYADSAVGSAPETSQDAPKKKVLVLGTGWAGTSFLKNLDCSRYEVKVISPRNYFAFTPLLPSVTCGTVEPRSIVEPIRRMFEKVLFFPDSVLLYVESNVVMFLCSATNKPCGGMPFYLCLGLCLITVNL